MFPQVLEALIGRVPRSERAVLRGHRRYALSGQVYPGMVRCEPLDQVEGLVLFDLTQPDREAFDDFEGEEYILETVRPELVGSGEQMPAGAYIWRDHLRPLLHGSWDPREFERTHLTAYVDMVGKFAVSRQR